MEASRVVIANPDTSRVPNSGPTVASRTAMVVGHLVEAACDDLKRRLADAAGAVNPPVGDALVEAARAWHDAHPGSRLVGAAQYQKPASIQWDEQRYVGDAYACYSWATYVADVEVDLRTFAVRVCDFVASQEIGRVIAFLASPWAAYVTGINLPVDGGRTACL